LENILKLIDAIGRFAVPCGLMVAFALFLPDGWAKTTRLYEMREPLVPFLWLALVFCASLAATNWCTKLSAGWRAKRKASKAKTKAVELFLSRLRSLSSDETLWIQYCLLTKQQTLLAHLNHAVANMLAQKRIVARGAGNVDEMPFTIPDEVWEILLNNESEFGVSPDERDSDYFHEMIQRFLNSLKVRWEV
jgi:Super-infection exclusion protein B